MDKLVVAIKPFIDNHLLRLIHKFYLRYLQALRNMIYKKEKEIINLQNEVDKLRDALGQEMIIK